MDHDNRSGAPAPPPCRVCSGAMESFGEADTLGRYRIGYFRCPSCGTVQTEEPYWLRDAYCEAINQSDVGLVSRNLILSKVTRLVISAFFDRRGAFLDYGGGYGLLVRLMRDAGFDFYRSDAHCANLFAAEFEAHLEGTVRYELATAYELLEHLSSPLATLAEILKVSGSVLCSTELLPDPPPSPGQWEYYGLDHGQHVTFYTLKSLRVMAERLGMNLYSNGINLHLFTKKKLCWPLFRIATSYKAASLWALVPACRSLTMVDYRQVLDRLKERNYR